MGLDGLMESNLRICKTCRVLKTRTLAGKYSIKDKKYVDETGSSWNGSNCPGCNKERLKNHMRTKRTKV
jgi:hypothetical protein